MQNNEILNELLKRLETSAPSRLLDADIFESETGTSAFSETVPYTAGATPQRRMRSDIPHYTTSLDVAEGLVPEGAPYVIMRPGVDGAAASAAVANHHRNGKNSAIALCAAALSYRGEHA